MHLVGFIIRIYDFERSPERQISSRQSVITTSYTSTFIFT